MQAPPLSHDDGALAPYLSVVAVARNDDHGGDFLARLQLFVDALAAQCERHGVPAELVLVEWNPVAGRPGLRDAIRWPAGGGSLLVRVVTVPPELHGRFANSDRLAVFQMIAKNVGIRRARAPFVLATNIDLIFSDGVMRRFAQRSLDRRTLYRVDRHDVEADVPRGIPVADQLEWCERHRLRICGRRGTRDLRSGAYYPIYAGLLDIPRFAWNTFLLERRDAFGSIRRVVRRQFLRRRVALRRGRRRASPGDSAVAPELLSTLGGFRRLLLRSRVRPHTNACGDFTLLARDEWDALRGYPELAMYSLHIDSLLLYMSRHAGNREVVLDDPVYHLEHTTGYRPDRDGQRALFAWLHRQGIPRISQSRFEDYVIWMAERRRPLELNGDDWGLAGESLAEAVIAC